MRSAPKEISPREALQRLETLCVKAERCRRELELKLRQWKIGVSDAEQILDSLESRRFVDDRRFASAFVRDRFAFSRWGRVKIAAELRRRGIPQDVIAENLAEIDPDEYEATARRLLAPRLREGIDPRDPAIRARLYRFLLSRGFEAGVIAKVLR